MPHAERGRLPPTSIIRLGIFHHVARGQVLEGPGIAQRSPLRLWVLALSDLEHLLLCQLARLGETDRIGGGETEPPNPAVKAVDDLPRAVATVAHAQR